MMRRARTALAATPVPLRLLLGIAVVLVLAWQIATPPLQGPDEFGHYAYTESLVEQHHLPWHLGDPPPHPGAAGSTALLLAQSRGGLRQLAGNPAAKDDGTAVDEALFRAADARLPKDAAADGGYTSAMQNPPVYYLYEALPYLAGSGHTFFARSALMRLSNLPFMLVIVVFTWLLAGLLFGPRRWLQTLATGVVALNPQLTSVVAGINPDALLVAEYAVGLYLMALVLLRGATRGRFVALGALCVVAGLTQGRGLPLVAPALVTAAVAWWRATAPHSARDRRRAVTASAAAALASAVAATLLADGERLSAGALRGWVSYLWQFYFPRLGFMQPTTRPDWTVRDAFIDRFWGTYGQLDTFLSPGLTNVIATGALAGVVLLAVVLIARRRTVWRVRALAGVLVVAVVSYVGVLHVAAWRGLRFDASDPVLTGRYLLVFVPLLGAAVAALVSWLPRRIGPAVAGGLLSGAFALQLAALGALIVRMHG